MKSILSALLILSSPLAFSQEWQSYFSDAKIDIQFAIVDHETPSHNRSHQRIIFNYENKTNELVSFSFMRSLAYDGQEITSDKSFSIVLDPNESKAFDRIFNKSKTYYVFSKDNGDMIKRRLSSFDITNITYQ